MKKLLTLFLFIPLIIQARTTYYVSNSTGSDANAGTKAHPYKTIAKINSITKVADDSILFKCGDTWTEAISITQSGTSGHPIVFDSYGSGVKPIITGLDALTTWVNTGGGIYSCTDANLLTAGVNIVTINGTFYPQGRFPKTGYRTYSSFSGLTSIFDATLPALGKTFAGAQVVMRKDHFTIDHKPVTSIVGGTINYSGGSGTNPKNNYGYYFQGSTACLTQLGDWYYDGVNKKIYMYFGTALPSAYTIKASYINNLVNINSKNYITINNLDFEGSNTNGINFQTQNHLTLHNLTINNSGLNGLNINGGDYASITNCTITNSNNNNIWSNGSSHMRITNNVLQRAGLYGGHLAPIGTPQAFGYACGALISAGTDNWFINNIVTDCGSNGVYGKGDLLRVNHNSFQRTQQITDDGGSIYFDVGGSAVTYIGRQIIGNVLDGTGNGAPQGTADNKNLAEGIYGDNNTSNVRIDSNIVANFPHANFWLHNDHTDTVQNNLSYGAGYAQMAVVQDGTFALISTHDMIIRNNYLFNTTGSQYSMYMAAINTGNTMANIQGFGTVDNNTYNTNNGVANVFQTWVYGHAQVNSTFASYKSLTHFDAASTASRITATTIFGQNLTAANYPISLPYNYVDYLGISHSAGVLTLPPFKGNFLIFSSFPTPPTGGVIKIQGYIPIFKN